MKLISWFQKLFRKDKDVDTAGLGADYYSMRNEICEELSRRIGRNFDK